MEGNSEIMRRNILNSAPTVREGVMYNDDESKTPSLTVWALPSHVPGLNRLNVRLDFQTCEVYSIRLRIKLTGL